MNIKIKVAIIGNGHQVQSHHLPYLSDRQDCLQDIEITWASGCACTGQEQKKCRFRELGLLKSPNADSHLDDWNDLLTNDASKPDAVVVSTPNSTHEPIIRTALEAGVHVAVDKPPTITSQSCRELVDLAEQKNCLFLTIAQRRYEEVFIKMKERLKHGDLGQVRLINYFIGHSFGPSGWRRRKSECGGGILLDSAFHGLDALLWMLNHLPTDECMSPTRVSADCILDSTEPHAAEQVEMIGSMRIVMSNGCILNVTGSYENPKGSIDESIKIFGSEGSLRYARDKLEREGMNAGNLTFQCQGGQYWKETDGNSQAKRWAPLEDFLNALKRGSRTLVSPASDSVRTLQIFEAAYKSARNGGTPIAI